MANLADASVMKGLNFGEAFQHERYAWTYADGARAIQLESWHLQTVRAPPLSQSAVHHRLIPQAL